MAANATAATELLVPSLRALSRLGPEVARRASESGLAILAGAGLPLRSFSDLVVRIPHAVAIALLENAVRTSGDPAFALHAGQGVERGDFGVLDLLAGAAPTLRDSMLLAARYLPLLHDGAAVEVIEQGEFAIWRHHLLAGVQPSAAANEYVVSAFFFSAKRSLGFEASPTEVHFMHAAPVHGSEYEQVFRAPVRFARERNAIVLPRVALDLPLVGADEPLFAVLTRHADELLKRQQLAQPFVSRVRELVRERLASAASLDEVAAALHMSESSVQRRLQAETTSYTQIVDDVRRELAVELLAQSDLNVSEVGFRLGFAHRPAFHRAFKRWYGMSPTEHRERNAGTAFYRFYRGGQRGEL